MLTAQTAAAGPTADVTMLGIGRIAAPMIFARNAEVYGDGEDAEFVYQVVSGAVRTYKIMSDGRRQICAFYLPGDVFGLATGEQHELSAEAVCNSTIAAISRAQLQSLAGRDGSIAHLLWTLTARELQRLQRHVLLLVRTAQERVAAFLLDMAERSKNAVSIELPMGRQDIADYLGLTIETVSRTLSLLEDQAAIALPSARRVQLVNVRELRRLHS